MKTDADRPGSSTGNETIRGTLSSSGSPTKERVLRGLGVSAGIAVGPAYVVETGAIQVPEYVLLPDAVEAERTRFHEAAAKARRQLRKLKDKASGLPGSAAEDIGFLLDAHLAMLSGSPPIV
jgi:phosphoenolpyruvate-protein phosphotransferase (PTS system enzyme I)